MYTALAFYLFAPIEDPLVEIERWKDYLYSLDAKGRIYLNHGGINAQMSLSQKDFPSFSHWLHSHPGYEQIDVKVHLSETHPFPKMTIKYRRELVALGQPYDSSQRGTYLSSEEWAEMVERPKPSTLILDVRNDYEWEIGHFVGARRPGRNTFREFPLQAKELALSCDPAQTPVMMYCTGGIRCEVYSSLLKGEGFTEVYQLRGGIIKYGQEVGNKHWEGKVFVFDDRLAVPLSDKEPSTTISRCSRCALLCDTYYNCAYMDCNSLFISCRDCAKTSLGCCSSQCMNSPRRRPFDPSPTPRPFRKLRAQERENYSLPRACSSSPAAPSCSS